MMTNPLVLLFFVLFGLIIGSFLNALIYRLPRELSIVHGNSLCPSCGHRLYAVDLVPLFSWALLRGKCRYCHEPISPRYPAVEAINAALYLAVGLRFGLTLEALASAILCSSLLAIAVIDWQEMLIPDSLCVAVAVAGVLLLVSGSGAVSPRDRLIGAFCVSVPLLLIALVSRGRAMGGGDIKLMAALGLCLGWKLTLLTTLSGAVLGTLVVLLLRRTRFALGREVPFGCFLAIAGIAVLFGGEAFLGWYLGLLVHHHHGPDCTCQLG
ncbi:MAG: prepilin peptidase [Oscillospiraceae bacterium]